MKYFGAREALRHGVPVRHESWLPTHHYRLDDSGLYLCRGNIPVEKVTEPAAIWAALSEFEDGWVEYAPVTIH